MAAFSDDVKRSIEQFPADVQAAHTHASNHRVEVLGSDRCGCFYCFATFSPQDIDEWIDEVNGEPHTALCPSCGVDSVIGDRSGFDVSSAFLKRMSSFWF